MSAAVTWLSLSCSALRRSRTASSCATTGGIFASSARQWAMLVSRSVRQVPYESSSVSICWER